MEAYKEVIYLVGSLAIGIAIVFLIYKLSHRMGDMGLKLAGIWTNESRTLNVLIHEIDSVFQGKIVWIGAQHHDEVALGFQVIRDLVLKRFFQVSSGIYMDPRNGTEMFFRLWFKGHSKLKFSLISMENGKVLKEENWVKIPQ